MADTDFNAQVRETILHLLAEANRVPFLFRGIRHVAPLYGS